MQDLKVFKILSAEKMCPHFLSISRGGKNSDLPIETILDEDGKKFDLNSLNNHVTNFYSELYRPDPDTGGSIEDFLGPAICNSPLVQGSILTEQEKNELDMPLSPLELEKSLNSSNLKSAPGRDGYSYRIIKKFWPLFKKPLLLCALEGLENNSLPESFKEADIKIIPKKGDTTKIKNWRPISLLSNFYKIVSRAINERLKKISNRILSRAQKGFNQKRYIHEVLINVFETIDYCKRENIQGAIVSIDQSKAFDSVDHLYMEKVYNFFGFGEKIKKWLLAIGTNRKARICLGNNNYTDYFPLGRGHAQGDSPSPLLYNFAAQILLFKIELTEKVARIRCDHSFPGKNSNPLEPFLNESNK